MKSFFLLRNNASKQMIQSALLFFFAAVFVAFGCRHTLSVALPQNDSGKAPVEVAFNTPETNPEIAWTNALKRLPAVTSAAYPEADSVSVFEWEKTAYCTNGTYSTESVLLVKALTQSGVEDIRIFSFWNNDFYGSFTITEARIHGADGTVRDVDIAAHTKEVVDSSQLSSNIHNANDKNISLQFPGIRVGDAVEVRCRRDIRKARVENTFSDYLVFESSSPVLWQGVEIRQPATLPIRSRVLRNTETISLLHAADHAPDGTITERWIATDTPRFFKEPQMPPAYTCTARLLVSTLSGWEELSRWYAELCEPRLAAVNDDIRQKVAELTDNGRLPREKRLESLFRFVSRDIRYMGTMAENEAPGYEPHDVSLTFSERNGVCRDKAALLVAMLRLTGINAWPVLIHTDAKKDPAVPQPFFNHAIVAADSLDPDNPYILMDPTSETTRSLLPEYLYEKSYLVARAEGDSLRETPAIPAEKNTLDSHTFYTLREDGSALLESTLSFHGFHDAAYRAFFAGSSADSIRRFTQRLVSSAVSGAVLSKWELSPALENLRSDNRELKLKIVAEIPQVFPVSFDTGKRCFLEPPRLAECASIASRLLPDLGLEKRRFPLQINSTTGFRETIEFILPESVSLLPRENQKTHAEGFSFTDHSGIDRETKRPVLERSLLLSKTEIPPAAYPAFRKYREIEERAGRSMEILSQSPAFNAPSADGSENLNAILAKVEKPQPPDDIFEERADTIVSFPENPDSASGTSGISWNIRKTRRIKVLSYAGQQAVSDFTFYTIPPYCNVSVVTAVVETVEGVRKPVDLSVNWFEADQPWVKSAPRYPAGKICTLSFPNVTPGATIEFTTEESFRNQPFFCFASVLGSLSSFGERSFTVVGNNRQAQSFQVHEPFYCGYGTNQTRTVSEGTTDTGLPVRTWKIAGAGPNSRTPLENNMPDSSWLLPVLRGGTTSPDAYASALAKQIRLLSNPLIETNAAAYARALVPANASVSEKIRAIRDDISKNLRQDGPAFNALPYPLLSRADTTLASHYGHALDIRILEIAMARALGLEPSLRFYSSRWNGAPSSDFSAAATQSMFNHIAAAIVNPDDGKTYLLEGTSQYAPISLNAFEGFPYLEIAPGSDSPLWNVADPEPPDFTDLGSSWKDAQYDISMEADGSAKIVMQIHFGGSSAESFRSSYVRMVPEERSRYEQRLVKSIAQSAQVIEPVSAQYGPEGPFTLSVTVLVPDYAVRHNQSLDAEIPGDTFGLYPLPELRIFPFFRSSFLRQRATWIFHPPKNYAPALVPDSLSFSTHGASYARIVKPLPDGAIQIGVTSFLTPGSFPPEQYPDYVRQALATTCAASKHILFEPLQSSNR
ncbi:MAG: DUF3857 domain-containing protein [Kiritimatiellia bacterium]